MSFEVHDVEGGWIAVRSGGELSLDCVLLPEKDAESKQEGVNAGYHKSTSHVPAEKRKQNNDTIEEEADLVE